MSYTANVYNVMIASPSDLDEERQIARQIILDWNDQHAEARSIVLQPLGWEHNSVPEMGGRPQGFINTQLVEKADLLIGIFWTRIGTSTGVAISGTAEEIDLHVAAGKQAMLYFSDKPIPPNSLNQKQFNELKRLKAKYRKMGIVASFDGVDDFRGQFSKHLGKKLNMQYFSGYTVPVQASEQEVNGVDQQELPFQLELSDNAKLLLLEASRDPKGEITTYTLRTNTSIKTNRKEFISDQAPRNVAQWQRVLEELLVSRLIEYVGPSFSMNGSSTKLIYYTVTVEGFEFIDGLNSEKG